MTTDQQAIHGSDAPAVSDSTGSGHSRTFAFTRWKGILVSLGILGALSRLLMLHRPTDAGTPIFDEKHYVPQAWQVMQSWDNPFIGGIEDNPGYGLVVHPPLGKQIEAIGMILFGYTPWGWRIMAALLGVAAILLIAATARRITRSDLVGLFAGVIALCDGILFVTGRSGMLDHFQVFLLCLVAYCAVRDAEQMEQRFQHVWATDRIHESDFGPRMGYRWWRFAAGVGLGLALAVKWNGLYYMAFFGLTIVAVDYFRRRRFGVQRPLAGTAIFDALPSFFSVVIVPVILYVISWRAWFASETGVFRHAVESEQYTKTTGDWFWSFLPDVVQNFIYYHVSVMRFHTELTNSNGHHHNWESKPWSWLVSSRSLLYYNPSSDEGVRKVILLVGTPAIWWFCVPAILWGLWCLIVHKDRRWIIPTIGFAAGFLPWLVNLDRQMYLFYAANLVPFLAIAIAMALGQLLRWEKPEVPNPYSSPKTFVKARPGQLLVVVYLMLVVWNFLYFLPLYIGAPLSDSAFDMRMWLPSWR
ncbi:dolichyl-phosphate-mannose--protein mannosyltransferase [Corynebacterium macclintockiae]|uniref:dolichyl-phosphate-mannose--protein mannosyltransferase n=1 Tax=Corynebacterium macclintockiae TaxID=2913501 RepID=UPI003EBD11B8